jgi:hypothetical protein
MSDDETKPVAEEPTLPVLEVTNLRPLPFGSIVATISIDEDLAYAAAKAFLCLRSHGPGCRCAYDEVKEVVTAVFGATVKK